MAYKGGIDYLDLPFNKVEWETRDLTSPWMPGADGYWHTANRTGNIDLRGVARDFDLDDVHESEGRIIPNMLQKTDSQTTKCIVLGRYNGDDIKKEVPVAKKRHYVLIVGQKSSNSKVYERVGVGFMPGRCILTEENVVDVIVR
jgi:hypothetical protein